MNLGCVFIGLIDKIYWFCMSNFTANFQGLELHSSPARLQKLLNLEKLSHYLRKENQKLKEFRVCTNIPILFKYNGKRQEVMISWKRTILWRQQRQCPHVYTSFYLCLQCILPRSGHGRFDKHLIPKIFNRHLLIIQKLINNLWT